MSLEPDSPDPDDFEIDPEQWVEFLLAHLGDEQAREILVSKMVQRSGLLPEQVEKILHATLEYLMRKSHSN